MSSDRTARQLVGYVFALVIGTLLVAALFGALGGMTGPFGDAQRHLFVSDATADIPDEDSDYENLVVEQTLGDAAALTGANDSEVVATFDGDRSGTWELCTYARADDAAADRNMTAASWDGEVILQYIGNQSSSEWVGLYWDAGEREWYDAAMTAPDNATSWTHVCLRKKESDAASADYALVIARNASDGEVQTLGGGESAIAGDFEADNWHGRIDETRALNQSLSGSQRQQLVDVPSRPLPIGNRTARLMFDSFDAAPSTVPVYFTGTDAELRNATLGAGLGGDDVTNGTDYTVNGQTITVLDGGDLEGAPAVFVSLDRPGGPWRDRFLQIRSVGQSVLIVLAVVALAFAGSKAHALFREV